MSCLKRLGWILLILSVASGALFAQDKTFPFSLECPAGPVRLGETIIFSVKFPNPADEKVKAEWSWTISNGTITSGQATALITVEGYEAGSITVTVERKLSHGEWVGTQKTASCTAQVLERPPILVDEFRTAGRNCEEGFARLDSFLIELHNNPQDQGVILLYGDANDAKARGRRQLQLSNHITMRRFDRSRITFIRGPVRREGMTQFWRVPAGSDMPEVLPADVDTPPEPAETTPTKPYIYADDGADGIPGCNGNLHDLGEYAKVLKNTPGSTGRIVISISSRAKFNATARTILAELAGHGIPRGKIRTVYKYVRPSRLLEMTELWVVPPSGG